MTPEEQAQAAADDAALLEALLRAYPRTALLELVRLSTAARRSAIEATPFARRVDVSIAFGPGGSVEAVYVPTRCGW